MDEFKRNLAQLADKIQYCHHQHLHYMPVEPVARLMGFSNDRLIERMLSLSEGMSFDNIGANYGDLDSPHHWIKCVRNGDNIEVSFTRSAMVLYADQRLVSSKNIIWQHARTCALVIAAFDLHRSNLQNRTDIEEIFVKFKDNEAGFLARQTNALTLKAARSQTRRR